MTNSTIVLAILGYIAVLVVSIVVIYRIIGREQKPADAHGAAVDEQAARFLKERCAELELKNAQRTLLLDLVTAVTRSGTFDDLAKNTVDSLCTLLRTGMAGLLWKCAGEEKLEFKYVRGYTGTAALRIPLRASLAGLSILRREPLFVSGPRNDVMYVPIPSNAENNVLCLPLPMFGEYRGVLRPCTRATAGHHR